MCPWALTLWKQTTRKYKMPNEVNKSPIKMSTEKYLDVFDKNLDKKLKKGESVNSKEGKAKVASTHKETAKQLGYTYQEASKRMNSGSPRQKATNQAMAVRTASVPPKAIRKPKKPDDYTRTPRKK